MKKINSLIFITVLTLSYQVFAASPGFEAKAQAILDRYNMKLGNDQHISLNGKTQNGQACTITVYNVSKLSETFPLSSKANQRLEITIQVGGNATSFRLNRVSQVTEFLNQIRIGTSFLNVSAKNKTGISDGLMTQSLEIKNSVGPHRSSTTTVTDFGGNSLTCSNQ